MQAQQGAWSCIGDFNAILGAHEGRGQRIPSQNSCKEFKNFTDMAELMHLDTAGVEFTWSNKRRGQALIERRLDRSLCNLEWLSAWDNTICYTLRRVGSDHHPIIMSSFMNSVPRTPSFKFKQMWSLHSDCESLIQNSWSKPVVGCVMFVLNFKLKRLKKELKAWNKDVFGDINNNVKDAYDKLEKIQQEISSMGSSNSLLDQEEHAQSRLLEVLNQEEMFWKEKSRMSWFKEGDRNTASFHKMAKIRHASKAISYIRSQDSTLTNQEEIAAHAVLYYQNLFSVPNRIQPNNIIEESIPHMVTEEENRKLTSIPSLDEVKEAVFNLNKEATPGPDGFGGV